MTYSIVLLEDFCSSGEDKPRIGVTCQQWSWHHQSAFCQSRLNPAAFSITHTHSRQNESSVSTAVAYHLHQKVVNNTNGTSARCTHSQNVKVFIMLWLISVYFENIPVAFCSQPWGWSQQSRRKTQKVYATSVTQCKSCSFSFYLLKINIKTAKSENI